MSRSSKSNAPSSLKTRSIIASSQASSRTSVNEARRRAELSKLKASQAQRSAAAKAEAARQRARLAETEALVEAQAARDQAEQDELELALLEEEHVSTDGGHRSVSRSRRDTPRPELQHRPPTAAAPEPTSQTSQHSGLSSSRDDPMQRTGRWIAHLPITDDGTERPPVQLHRNATTLPALKLETYDGSPLEWPRWSALFKALVHDNPGLTDTERLVHLQSSLKGTAREAVRGLLCDGTLYAEALSELERQFGNPSHIVRANLRAVLDFTPVRSDADISALAALSSTLHCTVNVLHTMHYDADLAATQNVQQVVDKLPRGVAWRWGEHCVQRKLPVPTLTDLDRWLRSFVDAGRFVSDLPADQLHGSKQTNTRYEVPPKTKRRECPPPRNGTAMHQWRDTVAVTESSRPVQTEKPVNCKQCQGLHTIPHCSEFSALSLSDRAAAVRQLGLCWICLGEGHVARKCVLKQRCTVTPDCNGQHHSLLHGAPRVFQQPVNSSLKGRDRSNLVGTTTEEDRSKVVLQILPLTVYGPNGRRTVNVMLDLGSQVTLIREQLADDLGLQGPTESLTLGTVGGNKGYPSRRVDFSLHPKGSSHQFSVRDARTTPVLNVNGPAVNWPAVKQRWAHLIDLDLPGVDSRAVDILLGSDALDLIVPREVREGPPGAPWAVLTRLGWVATGRLPQEYLDSDSTRQVNHIKLEENSELHDMVTQWWKTDSFGTKYSNAVNRSKEDKAALDILNGTTKRAGERYETGLLWKSQNVKLHGNVSTAMSRLISTERKLDRDEELAEAYCATMTDYIEKGYAEKLSTDELEAQHEREWYLPHHAVQNVHKPGKTRVVFDAAACHGGTSLNEQLLTGPDLTNSLTGILMRFRQRPVALAADINAMFHQVRVRHADQPALRFLWRGMDRQHPPSHYQMQVLIFGAASSPCSATFVLRKCADDFRNEYPAAAAAVHTRFYVDDYLDSLEDDGQASEMQKSLSCLLAKGGFTLSKWASSSPAVMLGIDCRDHSMTSLDLGKDGQKWERALGVYWDTTADMLTFKATTFTQLATKRNILSRVSSVFDPLGMLAPWVLTAKCLLQNIWKAGFSWDEEIKNLRLKTVWKKWTADLQALSDFRVPRCYRQRLSIPVNCQLHIFGDASEVAFGVVAYLRYTYEDGHISCTLVLAKNRVAPLRQLSVPRLELQAAVMAVRAAAAIKQEHDIEIHSTHFWSDSRTVLHWINNESRRYQNFVANRIAEIQDESDRRSWRHVPGVINPADVCSRGCDLQELLENDRWIHGPEFLSHPETEWPAEQPANEEEDTPNTEERREVRICLSVRDEEPVIDPKRFSNWRKLLRVTAWLRRFLFNCRTVQSERKCGSLTPDELREAELHWCRSVQREVFREELNALQKGQRVASDSKLLPLNPFMDSSGLIRVGGRLRHATVVPYEAQHQVILPSRHEVTRLMVTDRHRSLAHAGANHVLSHIRQTYWILRGRAAVRAYTFKCPACVRARATPQPPMMADLPSARVDSTSPPFAAVGVDFFGPIMVKKDGREEKRYGCIFTCLSTRAVHLEVSHSLDTDSLIMCLRRMMARRGHPRVIYSDNGTAMRGAERELRGCLRR